jgi:hypothetical protein
MSRTMLVFAALCAVTFGAEAQVPRVVRVLEKSYELDFKDVSFPTGAAGNVTVKPCATCEYHTHSLGQNAVFMHNKQQLSFDDFQKLLDDRRVTSRPTYAVVHYSIDTNLVTRITIRTE